MPTLITVSAFIALPFLTGVDAFWRMNCAIIQTGRVDPIVNPGALAAHAHTIVGGSNVGVNATNVTLLNSKCTSCEIQTDKSAYWSPLLYYNYPNGTFIEVPHTGSVVYYLGRGMNTTTVPFPPGFRVLSGNKAARSYDNQTMTWGNATYPGRPVADRVTFACLTAGTSPPEKPYLQTPTACINGMRAQVAFQACWNGVDLYKSDNSHVAYLSAIDNGVCPPGYEYQLPLVFVETDYQTGNVPDGHDDSRFVFSQGDPTGYGFHADFQNGWVQDVLINATQDCLTTGGSGLVSACPILAASDTTDSAYICPETPQQVIEPVHGLIDKLPGCITITYGPDAASAASMNCAADVPMAVIATTVDSVPRPTNSPIEGHNFGLANQVYMGCYNDSDVTFRTLNSIKITNYTAMTVEWCQQYCMDNGYLLSGLEISQECHCDNEINPTSQDSPLPNPCTWTCGGTLTADDEGIQEPCGGAGYMDVYRNTNTSFVAFGDNSSTAGAAQKYAPPAPLASNYLGCYTDVITPRALEGSSLEQNNMTLEICETFCQLGTGFQYYATEYASQCYCGNFLIPPSVITTPTSSPANDSCNMPCAGNAPQICGGMGVMSLYNNTQFIVPSVTPSVGKYLSGQCLTDPNPNNAGRSLDGASTRGSDMTVELCIKFCLGHYYHYAGVEYGQECYCGNEISMAYGGHVAPCNATDLVLCAGSQSEYCGGGGFMNMYYSSSL